MKAIKLYCIVLIALAGLQGCAKKNQLPSLKETYQYEDAKPFGGQVAYELLETMFPNKYVNVTEKDFHTFRSDTYIDSSSLYISLSKKFYCTEKDANAIIEFVNDGHTAFIASSYLDTVLLTKIGGKQAFSEWYGDYYEGLYQKTQTSLNDSFGYYYHSFINHFTIIDSVTARVVGRNQTGKPNLVVFFIGKGRLYLHCDPRAFSNYFLLKEKNYRYMQNLMQFTKESMGNIFWDDHYNQVPYRKGDSNASALGILFRHPPLTIAFWILLLLLLFYILFNGKRKQRIIPVIKPVENTSIAFTQAIAGLYMTEKNNKTIADKMITYFNDYIRNRYFLSAHGSGYDFVQTLSKKSGVSFESVQALYNTIEQVQLTIDVSDFELLTLNEQIQQFYKNRN